MTIPTTKEPFNLNALVKLSALVNLLDPEAEKLLKILPRDPKKAITMEKIVEKHFSGNYGLVVYRLEETLVKKGIVKKNIVTRADCQCFVYSLNPEWIRPYENYKLLLKHPEILYRYIQDSIHMDIIMRKA